MNGTDKKIIDLLTICTKAGKTARGFESVKESLESGKAKAVLICTGLSAKTEKNIAYYAGKAKVPVIKTDLTMEELHISSGLRAGVVGVCDEGFGKRFAELSQQRSQL